jgi:LuxR family maltose regulon positive regulatory protein
MQEGLNYHLTLISAPAGFGKTTLIGEWVRQNQPNIQTAWFSVDKEDNDPARFWSYFIAALRTLQPDCGEKILPLLHSSQSLFTEPMLDVLLNDLSVIAHDFIVVLDDYHLISSQQIHNSMTYLLKHMPSIMHLILATRADPPFPLALYRGRGDMQEIGANDLRFSLKDAASLLKELKILGLSTEDVTALNDRTEGWAVGLKMAALSLRGNKDIHGFIATFTGSQRYVMDYLLDEVLQKQSQEVCDFLLKTSILERITAPLCCAITGYQNSNDILLELERGHLFIVPLDESRQWYRYEHLFIDLLRHQCEIIFGTNYTTTLHQKAVHWFEENGFPDDAIYHALAAKDWVKAVRLIYPRIEDMRNKGQWNTVFGWLRVIPEEFLHQEHRLYCQYASFLAAIGHFDAAKKALNYLEKNAQDDAILQSDVAFILSTIAWNQSDIKLSEYLAKKALSLLSPDYLAIRGRAIFHIAVIKYIRGLFHEAEKLFTDAYEIAQQGGDIWVAAWGLYYLGKIKHQSGKLHKAEEFFNKTIELAWQTQGVSGSQARLCILLYEWNDLEAAANYTKLAASWYELGGNAEAAIFAYFVQAQIYLANGDITGAKAAIERLDRSICHPTHNPLSHAYYSVFRIIFAIRQNNLVEAYKWRKYLNKYAEFLDIEYQYILGRLLIAQGRKEMALDFLHQLYEKLIQANFQGLVISVRVCQALADETEENALRFLADALIEGECEGFIRSFVDEGDLLKPLLEKALSKGITPEYTKKLISIIDVEKWQRRKKKNGESITSLSQSILSEREFEVLGLMAKGFSNQQIAGKLIISLGTTKNHVHNVLEKLGVKSRTQAVTQARELKLI